MASLTSRERVLRALSHQEVDRVPIDLGGTHNSTMCLGACENFRAFLGTSQPVVELSRVFETARMQEDMLARLPVDTRAVFARPPAVSAIRWLDEDTFVDEWGVTMRHPPGGKYYDPVAHPLAEASIDDLASYAWPDVADPSRYAGLAVEARALHEGTGYAVCGSTLDTTIFDKAWMLRGMQQFLSDLLLAPEFAQALLDKVEEIQCLRHVSFLKEVGGYLDVLVISDDLGVQRGPLIRPSLYRSAIKPHHRRYIATLRRHTGAKILNHACGSIADLVEDYIDLGIDALHPMQVSAAHMAPAELKARFGGRMAWWGGIDTQHLLPRGTPGEVRQAVRAMLGTMGRDGGYVLAAVHNVQDDVPPANVWAMLDEAAGGCE